MSEQLSLSPPSLCRYAAALGKPRQFILEAQKSPFAPLRRGCVRLWFGGTKNRKTPSLIGTIKKQIVVVKSVFGEMKMDSAGRRLEGEHLSEPLIAWPLQLKAHPRAGIKIASVAQIVEGKRASDHKKTNFPPWFLLHTPSAQGKAFLQTRIFNETLHCTAFLLSQHRLSGLKYGFQTYFIYI